MKSSTYKNWRRHETNAKTYKISLSFPVSVTSNKSGGNNAISIKFENEYGERITFNLNDHDTALMIMQIDKHYYGKQVDRKDYRLDELYKETLKP